MCVFFTYFGARGSAQDSLPCNNPGNHHHHHIISGYDDGDFWHGFLTWALGPFGPWAHMGPGPIYGPRAQNM